MTSNPSKHSMANIRAIKCEFIIHNLIHLIQKIDWIWVVATDGLKTSRDVYKTGGYADTLEFSLNTNNKAQIRTNKGSVNIETDRNKIGMLNEEEELGWSVVK